MTSITISNKYRDLRVINLKDDLSLSEMMELIEDSLLGLGYRFDGHFELIEEKEIKEGE